MSQRMLTKNAVSDVIVSRHYVIDYLFIMRFYLSFIFPFMGRILFLLLIFYSCQKFIGSLTFHPHSQHADSVRLNDNVGKFMVPEYLTLFQNIAKNGIQRVRF